jgi:hypothetical protein
MVLQPRRQPSLYSPPWESQILPNSAFLTCFGMLLIMHFLYILYISKVCSSLWKIDSYLKILKLQNMSHEAVWLMIGGSCLHYLVRCVVCPQSEAFTSVTDKTLGMWTVSGAQHSWKLMLNCTASVSVQEWWNLLPPQKWILGLPKVWHKPEKISDHPLGHYKPTHPLIIVSLAAKWWRNSVMSEEIMWVNIAFHYYYVPSKLIML